MNNNQNNTSNMTEGELFEEIRALSFVKTELELYLDTHPDCAVALDYYRQTVAALKKYTEEYESKYSPICASGAGSDGKWSWINMPWPWQYGRGEVNTREGER
ncbi:MAG: spore coat protein CotJB [Clostridia bacterium]|nr:spore coat protein CotJB [Clostridia bacterium]MBQ8584174.1 spore coat protein CotJB [Clostridia bacterium]